MNQVKWWQVGAGLVVIIGVAGCAGGHGHGHGAKYREAAVERGLHETNELLGRVIKDPDKAKQAQSVVGDIVAEVKQSYQASQTYHQKLYALNAKYEATPEEFTPILDEMNHARMASASKILGSRFKLKSLMTAQEWAEFAAELEKTRASYLSKSGG
jgi:hypothetical protein